MKLTMTKCAMLRYAAFAIPTVTPMLINAVATRVQLCFPRGVPAIPVLQLQLCVRLNGRPEAVLGILQGRRGQHRRRLRVQPPMRRPSERQGRVDDLLVRTLLSLGCTIRHAAVLAPLPHPTTLTAHRSVLRKLQGRAGARGRRHVRMGRVSDRVRRPCLCRYRRQGHGRRLPRGARSRPHQQSRSSGAL